MPKGGANKIGRAGNDDPEARTVRQRKFLGFSFTGEREPRRRIAPKAIARFKERIREQTRRTRGISLKQMVTEIAT
jgi:hypothetical protein